jgi:hypothetical protein
MNHSPAPMPTSQGISTSVPISANSASSRRCWPSSAHQRGLMASALLRACAPGAAWRLCSACGRPAAPGDSVRVEPTSADCMLAEASPPATGTGTALAAAAAVAQGRMTLVRISCGSLGLRRSRSATFGSVWSSRSGLAHRMTIRRGQRRFRPEGFPVGHYGDGK